MVVTTCPGGRRSGSSRHRPCLRFRISRPTLRFLVSLLVLLAGVPPVRAWHEVAAPVDRLGTNPGGVFVQDGSYVMNVGEVQINITNWGLIGSTYSQALPWSHAPSCQWPAGSGNEYLYASSLWVGGVVLGERLCTTGGEVNPRPDDIAATIYEAVGGRITRPAGNPGAGGNRAPMPGPDDDGDGRSDEEILNGADDDGDGLSDEDFGQVGNQMMVLTNYDNTRLAMEQNPDHTPLNLEIVQTTMQWENDQVDDFVGFDYRITNIGVTDIERVYIGFYSDSDIGPRGASGTAGDDLAGSWPEEHGSPGLVRASDGSFVPIQVGYMYDGAENGRLDGYFGIVFLGHDVDPTGRTAPPFVGMRTFQSFSNAAAFEQGGDPTNDDERYQLLSAPLEEWDGNTPPNRPGDFRFLVSAGPFEVMPPGETLNFQVGMVVGAGLGSSEGGRGLLAHCAEAALTWYGIYSDEIGPVMAEDGTTFNPGQGGRETLLCREDFAAGSGANPWDDFKPDFMDQSCLDPEWTLAQPGLTAGDRFAWEVDGVTKTCAMFNMDNCFECARQLGYVCGPEDFELGRWTCNDPDAPSSAGCTGVDGLETRINWLVGMAPPPPGLRLWPADGRVHVFWDDQSMVTRDIRLGRIDFESFRIWRADNWDRPFGTSVANGPASDLWQIIAEYDIVNSHLTARGDTLPLGANTGLQAIAYRPRCLDDPKFAGLADAMRGAVLLDPEGIHVVRPALRGPDGAPNAWFGPLGRWESWPTVLDTFWAVTPRDAVPDPIAPVAAKRATRYFEYVDREVHNGFIYFYSVTATDHELRPSGLPDGSDLPVGEGLAGDPGSSFAHTSPGAAAQTAAERARFGDNIYVYPNPATRAALAEYQELNPSAEDPTGVRVTFTNLPAARNRLQIYTVSGDLVADLTHDGRGGQGHLDWNLMSRNGQEVVSGIYLYAIRSDDGAFADHVGKFVVVR